MFPKLLEIKVLKNYTLYLKYDDNSDGEVNLTYLLDKTFFKPLVDKTFFKKVYIDTETKAIAWNEDIDLCPDTMYLMLKKISFEEYKSLIYATN